MTFRQGFAQLVAAGSLACGMPASIAGAEGPVRVAAPDGPDRPAKQPQAAFDANGRIFVAYGRGNVIEVAASTDGGKSFRSRPVGEAPWSPSGRTRRRRAGLAHSS